MTTTQPSPSVHDEGGLAQRLARLVQSTAPVEPDEPADVAGAVTAVHAAVQEAERGAAGRDEALARGLIDLTEHAAATRAVLGSVTGDVGTLAADVAGLAARVESLGAELEGLRRQLAEQVTDLGTGLEARLGARIDEAVFAFAATIVPVIAGRAG